MSDVFQNIDALQTDRIEAVAQRLEFRGKDASFVQMRSEYFDDLELPNDANVLELGGGTGVVGRGYASRKGFRGTCLVTDLSRSLLEFGRARAIEEGLGDRVEFQLADAVTGDGLPDNGFDAAILHTVVSHVHDPEATLATATRCISPGGQVAVFDADYDSLQVVSGDSVLDEKANQAMKTTIVAHSTIMRDLPRVARALGLRLKSARPHFLAEIGSSEFFLGLARSYTGVLVSQGALSETDGASWVAAVESAVEREEFFGMCPYFSYLFEKPSTAL